LGVIKKAAAGPVTVNVQERPEVDVTVQVGSFNETITVNTGAAMGEGDV
jgi:hypothetical protein